MIIFNQEKDDGISIEMLCKGSITYASSIEPVMLDDIQSPKIKKSIAAYSDKDLYYVQSILVSSNWNKNDDIFDKAEVWMAKNTPEDKPTNLEHDENTIIGHIVSNWPIDEDGNIIAEDIEIKNLPDKFHIMTASVIYRGFTDPILRARSDQLIKEIEQGTKYVSMECFFNNFDYGLINQSNGEYKILNRNEETSYLTKYLRAYGGKGEFENYKIGRVLRRITFSGKGFVDKPANADSIIFTKNNIMPEKKQEIQKIGVFDNQTDSHQTENDIMSENTAATENTTDLNAVNAELVAKVEVLENQITDMTLAHESVTQQHVQAAEEAAKACEANVTAIQQEMDTVKQELASMYENKTNMEKEKEELMAMYDKKIAEMSEEMQKDKELLASYRNKEEERMMAEMYKKRMASLVEAGLSSEDAETTAKQFESFTDEQFDSIVATLTKVSTQNPESTQQVAEAEISTEANESGAEETSEEATDSEDETSEASAILDTVEVAEEVSLAVGGEEESEAHNTRAALIDFVYSRLGKK